MYNGNVVILDADPGYTSIPDSDSDLQAAQRMDSSGLGTEPTMSSPALTSFNVGEQIMRRRSLSRTDSAAGAALEMRPRGVSTEVV